MSGLQIVQKQERELSQAAPTLLLLLKFGAQWINDETWLNVLFKNGMTPYHLICQSSGDQHELLDLMLLSSEQALIDKAHRGNCTALVHAIRNLNINCVKSLLTHGANVNYYSSPNWLWSINCPLVEAMREWASDSEHSRIIREDIVDLLLGSGVDVNEPCNKYTPPPIICALNYGNVKCIKKLIHRGARLGRTSYGNNYVWAELVRRRHVNLLKNLLEHGIDKDSTDTEGKSMLWLVIESGDVEAIRYLLDLGVTLATYQLEAELKPCKKCGTNRLHIRRDCEQSTRDPCMDAISRNALVIFQLLEKHSALSFNSFNVLMKAIDSQDVMEYLLNRYTYPLDIEYTTHNSNRGIIYQSDYRTILMEACYSNNAAVTKMLLDHGADPNKRMCEKKCFSVINIAINKCNVEMVAHLIRSGLDINSRSYHYVHGYVLPFEAAVLDGRLDAAKMLFVSGGSCGVYSFNSYYTFKANINPNFKKIMKKWNVYSNNVNPLEQQCRSAILNHLSPQAHKKIQKLPLPHCIIKYLSLAELDDVMYADLSYSTLLSVELF